MPSRLKLELSGTQRAELVDLRGYSPLPYLRKRAAALLKITSGLSGREVVRHCLNRAH